MKSLFATTLPYLFLITTTLTPATLAHWNYDHLIVNGALVGGPYEYVRQTNNSNRPFEDVTSPDFRCNAGASSGVAINTSTYSVDAGSWLGFRIRDSFGHPGPQQVYLSRAPAGVSAKEYDGSGDWAKIYSLTTCEDCKGASDGVLKWATYRARSFHFQLPAETPPGEYLVRAEGLALHAAHKDRKAQFYIGCAQIKVTGKGEGVMEPTVEFPGGYAWNETGVLIPEFWSMITNYTAAGPALWPEDRMEQHKLNGTVKTADDD